MELVYPMFSIVLVTFLVALATAVKRIKGAKSGEIDPRYFSLMSNYDVPSTTAKLGKNLDNLFQVPTLFYAACCTSMALALTSFITILFAWGFVVLRIVHSSIHITYNNPLHRFMAFLLSFICVMVMWVDIVIGVVTKI